MKNFGATLAHALPPRPPLTPAPFDPDIEHVLTHSVSALTLSAAFVAAASAKVTKIPLMKRSDEDMVLAHLKRERDALIAFYKSGPIKPSEKWALRGLQGESE